MKHVIVAMSNAECNWLIKLLNKQRDSKIKNDVLNSLLNALERNKRIKEAVNAGHARHN